MATWHMYDHYGYAALAILGTLAGAGLVYQAMYHSRLVSAIAGLRGIAPPFINIVGVLFGLTLAFLANDTWVSHDKATAAVYKEADGLRSLGALSNNLPPALRTRLRQELADYANECAREWPLLAHRQSSTELSAHSDALYGLLASKPLAAAATPNIQSLMLKKMSDLRDQRDLRIALSQTHINPLKWLGMAFLGFLTLVSVALVHLDTPRAALAAILIFALASAPTAAIVLIQGNPFMPPAAITALPIQEAARLLGL